MSHLLQALHRPVALFPTVETSATTSLRWSFLIALIGCWGRKARCLVVLSLVLVSSLLVALTLILISSLMVVLPILLLLLRKLPMVLLLLVLTLMLVTLRVTLLELLGWVV